MNFFEQEFRKLFWADDMIGSPFYVNGVCFGTLGRDHLVQLEFTRPKASEGVYGKLKIVVAHRSNSKFDTIEIRLEDVLESCIDE